MTEKQARLSNAAANMTVQEYIRDNMPRTVRQSIKDEDTLIGLPYPYTVPCAERHFN